MRFLGFTFNVKREPRYASREDLTPLYQDLHDLGGRVTQLEAKVEATRVRVYQKIKQNGDPEETKAAAPHDEPAPIVLKPGDDPTIIFGR